MNTYIPTLPNNNSRSFECSTNNPINREITITTKEKIQLHNGNYNFKLRIYVKEIEREIFTLELDKLATFNSNDTLILPIMIVQPQGMIIEVTSDNNQPLDSITFQISDH